MPDRTLIFLMCLAEVVGMLSFALFPALLPTFMAEWSLSATAAGWLSGLFFAGYMAAVPVLSGLTDRMDARRVYLWSAALTGAATLGFAVLASDVWTAVPWRLAAGAGLAGTYMPGLKALTDRIGERAQYRAVSFYTASFGIGASLSYLFGGEVGAWLGWRWAFGLAAFGAALSFLLAAAVLKPRPVPRQTGRGFHFLDFRPVLRNRQAMAYILAYAAHNWELFGFRSWVVAFLAFAAALRPAEAAWFWSGPTLAAAVSLIAMPASVLGNEVASRFGRRRVLTVIMWTSAALSCVAGFAADQPYGLVVALMFLYGITVTGDSAAITTGAVQAAVAERKGATMAMHSFLGFGFAFLGSVAPGAVLDLAGGMASRTAWGLAFISMGAGVALGPACIWWLTRRSAAMRVGSLGG